MRLYGTTVQRALSFSHTSTAIEVQKNRLPYVF